MLKEIAIIVKNKIWFATAGKRQEHEARQRLEEYVKTLSPEKQRWANEIRAKLDNATPEQAVGIFRKESERISEQQMRVIERIDAVARGVTN